MNVYVNVCSACVRTFEIRIVLGWGPDVPHWDIGIQIVSFLPLWAVSQASHSVHVPLLPSSPY